MKHLTIQRLLATAAAAALVAIASAPSAAALNYCSSGTIGVNTGISGQTPGNTEYISNCQISDLVAVTFSSEDAPSVRDYGPITMRASNSNFGEFTRLLLLGKEAYDAEVTDDCASNFVVEGNTFKWGAMVYIRGVLAPGSSITISNNRFSFGYPLVDLFPSPPGSTDSFASAIYLHEVWLLDDAAIRITGNDIRGNSSTTKGFTALNAVYFGENVYYYGPNAAVEVSNNDIDLPCNRTSAFGTAVGGTKGLYMYAAAASFAIDGNRVNAIGSSSVFQHPAVVSTASGTTSISNNVVTANTVGMAAVDTTLGYRPVIRIGNLNIADRQVNTWIANNTLAVTGPLASIGFDEGLTCGTGCAVYVIDNAVTATGGDPRLFFAQAVEMRSSGAMWIEGNSLTRTDALPASSPIYFAAATRLLGTSTTSINGNVFSAKSPVLLAELSAAAQAGFTHDAAASLFMCSNTFGGSVVDTAAGVKAATSTQLGDIVSTSGCPATTTTTTTGLPTTTAASEATSTTEPETAFVSTEADTTADDGVNATSTAAPLSTTTIRTTVFRDENGAAHASALGGLLAAAVALTIAIAV